MAVVVWHGSQAEASALIDALSHNCACEYGVMGGRKTTCAAHEAFVTDQRFLDGVLAERQRRADLWREEQLLPREPE